MEVATLAVAAQELASQEPQEPALQELLVPQDLALALAQLASMALDPQLASTAQEQLDRESFNIYTLTRCFCMKLELHVIFISHAMRKSCGERGDINKRCQTQAQVRSCWKLGQ